MLNVTVTPVQSIGVFLHLNTGDGQYGWHRLHLRSVRLHV